MRIVKIDIIIVLLLLTLNPFIYAGRRVVIVHTNDTHSQIEPIANGDAGVVARKQAIDSVRNCYPGEVLVVDAGDFVQGSPYFNLFKGEVEIECMNRLNYDVVTLGNHEFDNGVEALSNILKNSKFDIVNCNYKVGNSALKGLVKPYVILQRKDVKVGFIGVGVDPTGLISNKNFKGIKYKNPIKSANRWAKHLKTKKNCDIVVLLSHLGYGTESLKDRELAEKSRHIDIIIGGHSHTLLKENTRQLNMDGKEVTIVQVRDKGEFIGIVVVDL